METVCPSSAPEVVPEMVTEDLLLLETSITTIVNGN